MDPSKMTLQERIEYVSALKSSGQYNCAQAVLEALRDQTGLDEETLKQLGSGFCAGMGNMEATCGALIAANMALGLKKQRGTLPLSKQLIEGFKEACGATKCHDLKQLTDGKPLCPCDTCVRNAVLLYGRISGLENG